MHVVATAGHVDHGKSALIRALTGMEPDRFAVERDRGMSIDLGFGWTPLESGPVVAFVDVPGHERYVGNALAGLGPSPAVLLAIAADEGWMPQTAEHVAAADALGIRHGVVAVTRSDLADPGRATAQAAERLAGTGLADLPVVAVSSRTGAGLPRLREVLGQVLAGLDPPPAAAATRLWVDRVFSMRGAGTVVTGTLVSGWLGVESRLALPRTDERVTVRGLQRLGEPAQDAMAISRVAVNLRNVSTAAVRRGDALVTPGGWVPTSVVDVRHPAARLPAEVIVHVGTAALAAATRRLDVDLTRLRLAHPLPLHVGDRLVLRDPGSRAVTAATVLDPAPPELTGRGAARSRAAGLASHPGVADGQVELRRRGVSSGAFLTALGVDPPGEPVAGDWYVDPDHARELAGAIGVMAAPQHRSPAGGKPGPAAPGGGQGRSAAPGGRGRAAASAGGRGRSAGGDAVRAAGGSGVTVEIVRQRLGLPDVRLVAALAPPGVQVARGLVRVTAPSTMEVPLLGVLRGLPQPFTVSQVRQALDSTRRVVLPLLQRLDAEGVTVRHEDGTRSLRDTYAAIVLAGGAGRRLGGPAKPTLAVGGAPMLRRVLDAVADAAPLVVVGPASLDVPPGVLRVQEEPAGGGPVAAAGAGLAAVSAGPAGPAGAGLEAVAAGPARPEVVALLAADLPFLSAAAVQRLREALDSTVDVAMFVDGTGRRQLLCGVWRVAALAGRLAELGDLAGRSMRELLDGLRVAEVSWAEEGPPPWYDCDTESDLRQAEEMT